ncbi:MAG: hypothetical protein EXQ96_02240 [Alphaproteobacteria bacterium]|nr:hypothetical protein [Alphaproteobacteria bacterium]
MRRVALALALALLAATARADGFLSVGEDVPLMPGLAEDRASAFVFDKPEGRIASAQASGAVEAAAVAAFYARALPALGWTAAGPLQYQREDERLTLTVEVAPNGALVRFFLTPDDQLPSNKKDTP